ncbi:hypothetical protein C8J57DRAFT_1493513 [Mycena rebaudengoi]|nr:hypothetical protein C8J57DRAFT_1493513 [Mycena rebaudengoi]
MNQFYDWKGATEVLDKIINDSHTSLSAKDDDAIQHLKSIKLENIAVQKTGTNRKTWRLGTVDEVGTVDQELVIRMQGIISKAKLSPGNVSKFDATNAINISQNISLVGFDSDNYAQCIQRVKEIHTFYEQHFSGFNMTKIDFGTDPKHQELTAGNRFFTSILDVPLAEHQAFGTGVDLMDVLPRFLGGNLVHTEDNVIKYYRAGKDDAGRASETVYDAAFPSTFQVGDIVEIHGSFVTFTTKKGRDMRMHFNLQTVTLLDPSFSKAASSASRQSTADAQKAPSNLKRKSPYGLNEGNGLNRSLKRSKSADTGEEAVASKQVEDKAIV